MDNSSSMREAVKGFLLPILKECMVELKNEANSHNGKQFYTREQVCAKLGIKTTSFYRLAKKGKITILKVEGKTVVDADELYEAISEGEIVRYGRNK